jgi:RHS repeat-associated protein
MTTGYASEATAVTDQAGKVCRSIVKLDYSYGTTNTNNGNVLTQTITIGATVMTQSYEYDALNRLSSASEGPAWSQTYDCDRYGNRAVRVGSYIPTPVLTPLSANSTDFSAFNQSTNRLSNTIQAQSFITYDTAGNLTKDAANRSMTYDAENRQLNLNSGAGQYSYDGDGRRVKKIDGSGTTIFVYNVIGQLIAEYTSGTPTGSGTSYLTSDHLGSTRVVTKSDGTVKARYDYLPFGEELGAGVGQRTTGMGYSAADSTKQKFTQKERDNESGLDYFLARYYSSAQGRFTSVDPLMASAEPQRPQSWNRYSYCFGNPLKFVDPDGREVSVKDEKALEQIRLTLPKEVRDQVKLDKNGSIDKDTLNKIKSDDQNFTDLKGLVNDPNVIEVSTGTGVVGKPEYTFTYKSVEQQRKELTETLIKSGYDPKDAAETAKAIGIPQLLLGYTEPATDSPTGKARVINSDGTGEAAGAPLDELVVTMAHELYGHGLPMIQGKPWKHDDGGPVDARIGEIQGRTRRNFDPGQPKTNPQPKKP